MGLRVWGLGFRNQGCEAAGEGAPLGQGLQGLFLDFLEPRAELALLIVLVRLSDEPARAKHLHRTHLDRSRSGLRGQRSGVRGQGSGIKG